jgi:uncharacterized protein (DUF1919 family)
LLCKQNLQQRLKKILLPHRIPSIVSDNCWGGELYKLSGSRYESPFVNCWISPKTYLPLLESIDSVNVAPLRFDSDCSNQFGYPVAFLGESMIGFPHSNSEEQAQTSFESRRDRFDSGCLRIKIDFLHEDWEEADVARWNSLPFPGVLALVYEGSKFEFADVRGKLLLPPDRGFEANTKESFLRFQWWRWLKTGHFGVQRPISMPLNRFLCSP